MMTSYGCGVANLCTAVAGCIGKQLHTRTGHGLEGSMWGPGGGVVTRLETLCGFRQKSWARGFGDSDWSSYQIAMPVRPSTLVGRPLAGAKRSSREPRVL